MVEKRQHAVKPRTREGDAFSSFVVSIFQLEGMLAAAGDAIAAPLGQTTARWRVLAAIEGEPLTVAQIARDWRFARQSVQRVADALAADGLLEFVDNPLHRRAKLAKLTADGRRVLRRIQAQQSVWANEAGATIGARDLESANELLRRILATLSA